MHNAEGCIRILHCNGCDVCLNAMVPCCLAIVGIIGAAALGAKS